MANTKVSQLPLYSGTAADLRWFVMNNSGQTETFKFSGYTSPFIVENYSPPGLFSTFGTPAVYDADCKGSIVIGSEAVAYNDYTTIIGWKAIGNNDIEGRCSAFGADAQATSRETAAFGMTTRATGFASTSLGHQAASSGERSTAVGNRTTAQGLRGVVLGCEASSSSPYSVLISSANINTLNSSGYYNNIFNGTGNSITGTTSGATMISCSGRTADANDTTYVENLRAFNQAQVKNLKVFGGQAQYGNYDNGSRATNYTIDWNNGNIQKVILTGSCVFSATNITDGTTYIFKVEQDNSGNRAATWSSGIFKFANGTPPTLSTGANDVDIFTFVAMDGLLYGVAQLNFG
jgi:hypothetical protein